MTYQSSGGRRSRLRSVARRLAWRRRSREAAVGRVARRRLGTAKAPASRSLKRDKARSRLRAWDRSSCEIATTRGPMRASTRSRCASLSVGEARTSKLASTLEAVTFACWPPGPEERLARTATSESGILSSSVIRNRRLGPVSDSLMSSGALAWPQELSGLSPGQASGGPRNRTSSKGFGDPHVTVTPVPQKARFAGCFGLRRAPAERRTINLRRVAATAMSACATTECATKP
jgi:hypothetical protein